MMHQKQTGDQRVVLKEHLDELGVLLCHDEVEGIKIGLLLGRLELVLLPGNCVLVGSSEGKYDGRCK